jgi:hypothetical protein
MEVAKGNCESVRSVGRFRDVIEPKLEFYHFLDLLFRTGTVAGDPLFNLCIQKRES